MGNPMSFEIEMGGKPAQVVLANLAWKNVTGMLVIPDQMAPERLVGYRASNVFWSVETIDGVGRTTKRREALDADPAAVAAIFAKRREIYLQIRGAGRMYAQCPHCHEGEVEMSLLALFDTLGVLPPEIISADLAFLLPPVSGNGPLGYITKRPSFDYASRIRFELPTKRLGLPRVGFEGGVLERATTKRWQPAWDRWVTDGINGPLEQLWRSEDKAEFHTTILLIAAVRDLVPPAQPTIEAFENIPALDMYFLDAIYHLAFEVSVPEHALPRTCPACARPFMPVAPWTSDA